MGIVESKTPDEIMAWLAGLVCGVCGGHGSAPEGCTACHTTGRLLWRLVAAQHHGMRFQPPQDGKETLYECEYCQRGGYDPPEVVRLQGEDCPKRPVRVKMPDLDILIDTVLDLGFASVFTPKPWDDFLPSSWIRVSGDNKVEQLLRNLEVLVTKKGLAPA